MSTSYGVKGVSWYWLTLIIISFAIAPEIAFDDKNRNLLLFGIMLFSPLVLLKYRKFYLSDIWLLLFMLSIVFSPLLFHSENIRWSTIIYSIAFVLTFLAYERLLHRYKFTAQDYLSLLKYLIYAYFIVLLIQQFCVLTGLPILNVRFYDIANPWKLNSLAGEPSHSARIVGVLMYSYMVMKEIIENKKYDFKESIKKDKWIWLSFLWIMLTMGSGTAILFLGVVLLKFIRFRTLIPLFILLSLTAILINTMGSHSYDRVLNVIMATATFDTDAIIKADHSASSRIVPMMVISQMVDFISINGWFGHGIDSTNVIIHAIYPGFPEGATGGGMFQLWWEYGFLTFILFVWFSIKMTFRKKDMLTLVFWFFLVFMYGVNSQIVWLTIMLLYTNIFFIKNKTNKYF